jgi:uncharacterized protein (DUF2235 family)
MPKNIVICCDGTGNKFCDRNTNVVNLYSVLDLSNPTAQIAYYHCGLGTMGAPAAVTRLLKFWTKAKGLAFGYGLTRDIGDAYKFLMDNYEEGDRVYLFGFSRGAYTARALSGMLHMLGLIRKGDDNLIAYAAEMLKRPDQMGIARAFKKTFCRECKVHFIGVWDTVSSVGWIWDPVHVPYTFRNPDLAIGRHAIAIDERRCHFRQNLWAPAGPGQDIKQVWFAGVHSDVGGGYLEKESGLAKITLEWMIIEARKAGLIVAPDRVTEVLKRGAAPDPNGKMHNSLRDGGWIALEVLPHRYIDMSVQPPRTRWKLPLARRRYIAGGSLIHESVFARSNYHPSNLPANRLTEPWVHWTEAPAAAVQTMQAGEPAR